MSLALDTGPGRSWALMGIGECKNFNRFNKLEVKSVVLELVHFSGFNLLSGMDISRDAVLRGLVFGETGGGQGKGDPKGHVQEGTGPGDLAFSVNQRGGHHSWKFSGGACCPTHSLPVARTPAS